MVHMSDNDTYELKNLTVRVNIEARITIVSLPVRFLTPSIQHTMTCCDVIPTRCIRLYYNNIIIKRLIS